MCYCLKKLILDVERYFGPLLWHWVVAIAETAHKIAIRISLILGNLEQHLKFNDITDNKTFWRTIKLYFNEKGSGWDKIALSGNEQLLISEKGIASTMNNYFINIAKHLNFKPHTESNTIDIG